MKHMLTIDPATFAKRNIPECLKYHLTKENVEKIQAYYKEIHGLPQGIRDVLMQRP